MNVRLQITNIKNKFNNTRNTGRMPIILNNTQHHPHFTFENYIKFTPQL